MKLSTFYKVENKQRYKTANEFYYVIGTKIEDKIKHYFFTENDLTKARSRALANQEDVPQSLLSEDVKESNLWGIILWGVALGFGVSGWLYHFFV